MDDLQLRFIEKCIHCGKAKNMHRASTMDCPNGKRTRTGYTTFGPTQFTSANRESAGQPPSDMQDLPDSLR